MSVKIIDVDLGARSYPILIGSGLLGTAGRYIAPILKGSRLAIITDETVADLHLRTLLLGLSGLDVEIETIVLPPGEALKSFEVLQDILARLLALNFSRDDTLLAFGGGVIGDLTGFVASILKRGCLFVQVPTTLLAQVDSSVGGKTAINTAVGKNLVGSFYQPKLVLADTDVLKTLELRQRRAGYAEVLKYALIDNLSFFNWLEKNAGNVLACKSEALVRAISVSCTAKAAIVKADEFERGRRALLNLGHTFAHALEAKAGFDGSLLHGEAVSAGMLMAFEFSQNLGLCSGQDVDRLSTHLAAHTMPVFETLPPSITDDANLLFEFMMHDKKNIRGQLNLILAQKIGRAFMAQNSDKTYVLNYLKSKCELVN
ncbi:MAG: 3-dehydroquinate synthase [Robiginitomaculum sp.]